MLAGPEGATSLARALARCKKLRILNLSRNQLTDAGAQILAGFSSELANLSTTSLQPLYNLSMRAWQPLAE